MEIGPGEVSEIEARMRQDLGTAPIFLPEGDFRAYYDGFCNATIWPLFHYFPQYAHYDEQEWAAYGRINQRFLEKVLELADPADTVWVHDYHLMLLPNLIRAARPEAKIGFFLHIPFPSYELFRMLPWREELLDGMLGADLVGFHSYGYTRHFLSSTLRLLGLENYFGSVIVDERIVKVDTFPIGIDVDRFLNAHEDSAIIQAREDLRQKTEHRKVILSVDRLDFSKGILARLLSYEQFLETHPQWIGKVTLISLTAPSRMGVPEYQTMKRRVDEVVGRINGRFGKPGWTPVWYMYRSVPFGELAPLYQLADVALVTPLRDGMNLVAKEYLASHPDGCGVLILSETAGAAEELGEAIIVNPHDQGAIVQALNEALEMPVEEQRLRNAPMLKRLKRYDVNRWADDFLSQLEGLVQSRPHQKLRKLAGDYQQRLFSDYAESTRRLILLDYDGTLVPFTTAPEEASPGEELRRKLRLLVDDPANNVVIISGRSPEALDKWLGDTGVDLAAEHGAQIKLRSEGWQTIASADATEWKAQLRPVLETFADRTPGAFVEEKANALAWHYRKVEPEMGLQRVATLIDALEDLIANTPLQILNGNKVIEVKHHSAGKGHASQHWLQGADSYDFIMAIGDDVTDEEMFAVMPEGAWSIKVRRAFHSNAEYYLSTPYHVHRLLQDLTELSTPVGPT
jgi:trehalose 6-phosphate synthase/phosphatase